MRTRSQDEIHESSSYGHGVFVARHRNRFYRRRKIITVVTVYGKKRTYGNVFFFFLWLRLFDARSGSPRVGILSSVTFRVFATEIVTANPVKTDDGRNALVRPSVCAAVNRFIRPALLKRRQTRRDRTKSLRNAEKPCVTRVPRRNDV